MNKTCHPTLALLLAIFFSVGFMTAHVSSAQAEELIVSAAASLTDAFKDIEPAFEAANPGVDVIMNFASSGALYRQIEQGAPADVFASANPAWMTKTVKNGLAAQQDVHIFAQNALVLAAPADNPALVSGLADLQGDTVSAIGLGAPATVPAGRYAKDALEAAAVFAVLTPKFIFCENVRQVLDYLSRGEVDCGFVYKTDALRGRDDVRIIQEIPLATPVAYPIAALKESGAPALAKAFVDFVISPSGAKLLEGRGFKSP